MTNEARALLERAVADYFNGGAANPHWIRDVRAYLAQPEPVTINVVESRRREPRFDIDPDLEASCAEPEPAAPAQAAPSIADLADRLDRHVNATIEARQAAEAALVDYCQLAEQLRALQQAVEQLQGGKTHQRKMAYHVAQAAEALAKLPLVPGSTEGATDAKD